MTILSRDRLTKHGPFVDFLEIDSDGQSHHVISLSDELLETYCAVTNTYLPFDAHTGGEFRQHEIHLLAREFFIWSAHISQCRMDANDIDTLADIYFPPKPVAHMEYEKILENIREDLVETSSFLAMEILRASRRGSMIRIVGL